MVPTRTPLPSSRRNRPNPPTNPRTNPLAPVCPANTQFRVADNLDINFHPMKKGLTTPRKLHLQLKATNGEIYTFIYPKAAAVNFETGANISAANKWRKQILNQRLHISGSGGDRAPWTKEEIEEIKGKEGYKKGRLLSGDELAEVARATGRSITAAGY